VSPLGDTLEGAAATAYLYLDCGTGVLLVRLLQ
jgi:hypothetical protein